VALAAVLLQPSARAQVAGAPASPAVTQASSAAVTRDAQSRQNTVFTGTVRVSIETPAADAILPPSFAINGWALDPSVTSGTGVDMVHVYAYPNFGSGEPPIFLGVADYGVSRPDIGLIFGEQFTASGFHLDVKGLAPGRYRVFAFAHTIANNEFSAYVFIDVSVAVFRALVIDTPGDQATMNQGFAISGWALDNAAPSGSGIDAVHIYLVPNDGAGAAIFMGPANLGVDRPDVGAAFGAQFTKAGYSLVVNGVAAGPYLLLVYGHSMVTNSFSLLQTRHIAVRATTVVTVDVPAANADLASRTFTISGWAIDLAASSGSGVDVLHVYAFPISGGAPVFLGVASTGVARADVGNIFGAQFDNCGYRLAVDGAALGLAAGSYDIVIWAHSSAAGAFTSYSIVRVRLP
jgi:hypothetical protein